MSLDDKIKTFLNSKQFKDRLIKGISDDSITGSTQKPKGKVSNVIDMSDVSVGNISLAEQYENEMRDLLNEEFKKISPHSKTLSDCFIKALHSTVVRKEDQILVEFKFDDTVRRPSLYPEKYPMGADLTEIFHNGINAAGRVFGMWHNRFTFSITHRDAYQFLYYAKQQFLEKHPACQVVINERYRAM